jgi:hypothetical protein
VDNRFQEKNPQRAKPLNFYYSFVHFLCTYPELFKSLKFDDFKNTLNNFPLQFMGPYATAKISHTFFVSTFRRSSSVSFSFLHVQTVDNQYDSLAFRSTKKMKWEIR